MTRICFVVNNLESGGAQRVLTILANAWAERGRTVHVVSIYGTEHDFFNLSKDVKHVVLNVKGPSRSILKINGLYMTLKRVHAIRKSIREIRPDIVISFLTVTNILTIVATIRGSVRLVISERNDPALQNLGRIWGRLRTLLYKYADIVTANTPGALESLAEYVPRQKLRYVPNPVWTGDMSIAPEGERENILLTVSSLRYQQAHDVLLKACRTVFDSVPGWQLTIVGDGELKAELKEGAERLEISDHIEWAGKVPAYPYYKKASIFVLATRHEGTPNSLLEAFSHKVPAIVSNASPGPLEYVKNEETGLVVPVEDDIALGRAILRLINNQQLRHNLAEAAARILEPNKLDNAIRSWETALGLTS